MKTIAKRITAPLYLAMGLSLSGLVVADSPTDQPIAERGMMGFEAYERVLDALDVDERARIELKGSSENRVMMEAMERARAAQREALQDEDRRFGYLNGTD